MKREGHLYLLIGLIAGVLVFFQFNPFITGNENLVSKVKKVDEFKQLLVNVKCNIYFIEGEDQGIVYEGPASMVKNIRITVDQGCITIDRASSNLKGLFFGWMNRKFVNPVNIYIVVHDIHSLETGNTTKMIVMDDLKNNKLIFPLTHSEKGTEL